eukprot:scaffold7428_cov153-Amphora_coffeaeformis.AAC.3
MTSAKACQKAANECTSDGARSPAGPRATLTDNKSAYNSSPKKLPTTPDFCVHSLVCCCTGISKFVVEREMNHKGETTDSNTNLVG